MKRFILICSICLAYLAACTNASNHSHNGETHTHETGISDHDHNSDHSHDEGHDHSTGEEHSHADGDAHDHSHDHEHVQEEFSVGSDSTVQDSLKHINQ